MPGAGGTYIYLREAFQYRTGRLMAFLFVWSAVLFIPLIMSTGIIGLVQYLGYLIPGVTDDSGNTALGKIIGVGITLLIMVALFRKIGHAGCVRNRWHVLGRARRRPDHRRVRLPRLQHVRVPRRRGP